MPTATFRTDIRLRADLRAKPDTRSSTSDPTADRYRLLVQGMSPDQKRALEMLARGCTPERYVAATTPALGPAGIAGRMLLLRQLAAAGLVRFALVHGRKTLAEAEPLNARFRWRTEAIAKDRVLALSPHAVLRADGPDWILEAPLGNVRVRLSRPDGVAIVAALARPDRETGVVRSLPSVNDAAVHAVLQFLGNAGALDDGTGQADGLEHWRWHDLYFHRQTRLGFMPERIGATGRKTTSARHPAMPATGAAAPIVLPEPTLMTSGEPFTDVLRRRRSIRQPGPGRIALAELSSLLFHALRPVTDGGATQWPYPRMGGLDVLAFHIVVRDCDGLARGVYAYRPQQHDLLPLTVADHHVEATMRQASFALGTAAAQPQLLIRMVVDFARLAAAYDGIAYRLALLTAGGVLQTLYLVATALDLAPCAIGTADSSSFAAAHGLDELACDAIAEMALGAPAPRAPARPSKRRRASRPA